MTGKRQNEFHATQTYQMIRIQTHQIFLVSGLVAKALEFTLVASALAMIRSTTTDAFVFECDHFLGEDEMVGESTFPA